MRTQHSVGSKIRCHQWSRHNLRAHTCRSCSFWMFLYLSCAEQGPQGRRHLQPVLCRGRGGNFYWGQGASANQSHRLCVCEKLFQPAANHVSSSETSKQCNTVSRILFQGHRRKRYLSDTNYDNKQNMKKDPNLFRVFVFANNLFLILARRRCKSNTCNSQINLYKIGICSFANTLNYPKKCVFTLRF